MNKFKQSSYCSNSCATFSQMGSSFNRKLLEEYRNINQWAIDFKAENKRKPKLADYVIYFNLRRLPAHADPKLFERKRDSKLELLVLYYLKDTYPEIETVRRFRQKIDGKWLELDLYFPEFKAGLEIQDLATHCKGVSDNLSKFKQPMKDDRYHKMKQHMFKTIGIDVYELWEDEIVDKTYEKMIKSILNNP